MRLPPRGSWLLLCFAMYVFQIEGWVGKAGVIGCMWYVARTEKERLDIIPDLASILIFFVLMRLKRKI